MKTTPRYKTNRELYPAYPASKVYEPVGENVLGLYLQNPNAYENAGVLRLSRALLFARHPIRYSNANYLANPKDNFNYIFRVNEIIPSIHNPFTKPDIGIQLKSGTYRRKGTLAPKTISYSSIPKSSKGLESNMAFHVKSGAKGKGAIPLFSYTRAPILKDTCEDNHGNFEHEPINMSTYKFKLEPWPLL